jgi:hypothetical protein
MARAIKIAPEGGCNVNACGGSMNYFSSRGPLLELIYQMHTFKRSELLARYQSVKTDQTDSDESVLDYLNQLTQINILKQKGDLFFVQPFLRD